MAKQDKSKEIANAPSGPYVPAVMRVNVTDQFDRVTTAELRPLTVADMLHIQQQQIVDAGKNGALPVPQIVDQLRFSIISIEGEALTGPPKLEIVRILDNEVEVPTRKWIMQQDSRIMDEFANKVIELNSVPAGQRDKIDFT